VRPAFGTYRGRETDRHDWGLAGKCMIGDSRLD
jgi:hypothetical protein